MTLEQFLAHRRALALAQEEPRAFCLKCRKAGSTCYCHRLKPFESYPRFVILIHKLEARKGVASGRMAARCLTNSLLLEGVDFTQNETVNALLSDPKLYPALLFPGPGATNLSELSPPERAALFPPDRELVLFILDGTWTTARAIRRLSPNLRGLPLLTFTPPVPSRWRVRRQPREYCYSTIETVHLLIELMGGSGPQRPHDHLLEVFRYMVEQQVSYVEKNGGPRRRTNRQRVPVTREGAGLTPQR